MFVYRFLRRREESAVMWGERMPAITAVFSLATQLDLVMRGEPFIDGTGHNG
jgi:hypothetical protein